MVRTPPPIVIYANTLTELYSYEVLSNTLTDIARLTDCGTTPLFNDLTIDSTGQMYLLQQNSGIYKLPAHSDFTI